MLIGFILAHFVDLRKLTFKEYLKTTDLTESLIGYVSMCIAMTEENASALEVKYMLAVVVKLMSIDIITQDLGRPELGKF